MENLEKLRQKWLLLVKKCKLDEANSIYWKELFPLVEEKFLQENSIKEKYDWLILPAGLESFYYILLIDVIKPKNVFFLGTREFKDQFLNKIIEKTELKASQYIVDVLDYERMDVSDVYEKIRKRLDLFYNKKVILDLTRGKRIMSVGAGIVGAFFGFDLVYIDEQWIDEIKRGFPGTEKLVAVKNPFDVFGDLEAQEARELFNHYNYGAAMFFYGRLREKVADPRDIEIEELLAESYFHWNSFNFKAALYKMEHVFRKSEQYNIKINPILKDNSEVLKILTSEKSDNIKNTSEEFSLHMIIELYTNALRKSEVGMYEDAISRLYRVLELISQYRLRSYGIETSNANLKKLSEDYKKISKEIYGMERRFPFEIGLKDGYILLFILKDYIVEDETLDSLKNMFGVLRVRDTSIIAHGLQLAGEKAFNNMNLLAKKFIEKLCKKQNKDFFSLIRKHSFIKLEL